jgi:hypothetical protein
VALAKAELVADGMNSEKPIRIRMMPPTIRTMMSDTSKISSSKVPKIRKKSLELFAILQLRLLFRERVHSRASSDGTLRPAHAR